MAIISDLYTILFGKEHMKDGDVISFSEHGRTGGVSTGQPFKFISNVQETTLIDEASSTVTYIGKTKDGSSGDTSEGIWQIRKILVSGSVTSIVYADGNTNYDNVWNDRGSITYS